MEFAKLLTFALGGALASRPDFDLHHRLGSGSTPCEASDKPLKVQIDHDYFCGSGGSATRIFYPWKAKGRFPVVLFQPGSTGLAPDYYPWLQAVAQQCLIVIIPATTSNKGGVRNEKLCDENGDLGLALGWAMDNPCSLGAVPDFERIGVMGHSMGARGLSEMVRKAKGEHNIAAAVLSHGGNATAFDFEGVSTMFITSRGDTKSSSGTPEHMRPLYDAAASPSKVFVDLKRGGHGEPRGQDCKPGLYKCEYQLKFWTGRFLACHLRHGDPDGACDRIYGDGETALCSGLCTPPEDCKDKKDPKEVKKCKDCKAKPMAACEVHKSDELEVHQLEALAYMED